VFRYFNFEKAANLSTVIRVVKEYCISI